MVEVLKVADGDKTTPASATPSPRQKLTPSAPPSSSCARPSALVPPTRVAPRARTAAPWVRRGQAGQRRLWVDPEKSFDLAEDALAHLREAVDNGKKSEAEWQATSTPTPRRTPSWPTNSLTPWRAACPRATCRSPANLHHRRQPGQPPVRLQGAERHRAKAAAADWC